MSQKNQGTDEISRIMGKSAQCWPYVSRLRKYFSPRSDVCCMARAAEDLSTAVGDESLPGPWVYSLL